MLPAQFYLFHLFPRLFSIMKYRVVRIPKRNGKFRQIYIASEADNCYLRRLIPHLEAILFQHDASQASYAFQKGKNCALHAQQHVGYRYTLFMDLENFFDSISSQHLQKYVPTTLLKHCLIQDHPRQGLPTSPILSEIAFLDCDKQIMETLKNLDCDVKYTRYADDLVFSCHKRGLLKRLAYLIKNIVESHGFTINVRKTKYRDQQKGRVIITGIAVDKDGIHPSRATKKKMRAALHQKNINSWNGLIEWAQCKLPNQYTAPENKTD